MTFVPLPLGQYSNQEVQRLAGALERELLRLTEASVFSSIILEPQNVEPEKVQDGLTVLADGTNWNPGSGQGVYTYYNSTWNKLG